MRLMTSQNPDEVASVRNELLKAGIASETRANPKAEALGVNGVELWVQNEQDFFNASKVYAQMQERAAGRPKIVALNPKGEAAERPKVAAKPEATAYGPSNWEVNRLDRRPINEPRREELKHASSLLEKGIETMFARERELAQECSGLRSKVAELTNTLGEVQAELESRTVTERNQTEQIAGLVGILERERQEWQQQLKCREEALKNAQDKLDSMSRQLPTHQAATAALKEQIVSLELQRDQNEIALANANAEAQAEREARAAAEKQAERAMRVQESLEQELLNYAEREQHIQAQVASLSALWRKAGTGVATA